MVIRRVIGVHQTMFPVVEDRVIGENFPRDLRDLKFKNDRGPSALQRIQA